MLSGNFISGFLEIVSSILVSGSVKKITYSRPVEKNGPVSQRSIKPMSINLYGKWKDNDQSTIDWTKSSVKYSEKATEYSDRLRCLLLYSILDCMFLILLSSKQISFLGCYYPKVLIIEPSELLWVSVKLDNLPEISDLFYQLEVDCFTMVSRMEIKYITEADWSTCKNREKLVCGGNNFAD